MDRRVHKPVGIANGVINAAAKSTVQLHCVPLVGQPMPVSVVHDANRILNVITEIVHDPGCLANSPIDALLDPSTLILTVRTALAYGEPISLELLRDASRHFGHDCLAYLESQHYDISKTVSINNIQYYVFRGENQEISDSKASVQVFRQPNNTTVDGIKDCSHGTQNDGCQRVLGGSNPINLDRKDKLLKHQHQNGFSADTPVQHIVKDELTCNMLTRNGIKHLTCVEVSVFNEFKQFAGKIDLLVQSQPTPRKKTLCLLWPIIMVIDAQHKASRSYEHTARRNQEGRQDYQSTRFVSPCLTGNTVPDLATRVARQQTLTPILIYIASTKLQNKLRLDRLRFLVMDECHTLLKLDIATSKRNWMRKALLRAFFLAEGWNHSRNGQHVTRLFMSEILDNDQEDVVEQWTRPGALKSIVCGLTPTSAPLPGTRATSAAGARHPQIPESSSSSSKKSSSTALDGVAPVNLASPFLAHLLTPPEKSIASRAAMKVESPTLMDLETPLENSIMSRCLIPTKFESPLLIDLETPLDNSTASDGVAPGSSESPYLADLKSLQEHPTSEGAASTAGNGKSTSSESNSESVNIKKAIVAWFRSILPRRKMRQKMNSPPSPRKAERYKSAGRSISTALAY
ncbi:hypothetical protein LTR84_001597 [Exophiala bonariae]|uniref:Helicase ATP-binding domain-containing protein n=1 Tax=Exophiala bonariae TaxID=1690606 RepID=A0AAV9NE78_9EURO|nr:hypothetical protein LTR84_001597 [Exophiala bonariae]